MTGRLGLGLALLGGSLAAQEPLWTVRPAAPTVGDTVVVSRRVATPDGWRLRAGKFESTEAVDALAEPMVQRDSGGWEVTYLLVAWVPGQQVVGLPPVWRLGPDGATDSLGGADVTVRVRSVLGDDPHPQPEAALAPIERPWRRPWAPVVAGVLAAALGVGAVVWRRRRSRPLAPELGPRRGAPIPDATWLAAGEPKAVAARAAGELRTALASAEPRAAVALSTVECLMVLEGRLPRATLGELTDVLAQLDRVAFASAHGADVGALAGRARALARALAK
jgi:hypothetical protein